MPTTPSFAELQSWLLVVVYVTAFFVVGKAFEKMLHSAVKTQKANSLFKAVALHELGPMLSMWVCIAGTSASIWWLPLHPTVADVAAQSLQIATLVLLTMSAASAIEFVVRQYVKHALGIETISSLLALSITSLVYLLGGIAILSSYGVSVTPLVTTLGVGGIAVALGLQESLSSFFAGITLIWERAVRPGDYLKLATGEEGRVIDISWRITIIETPALETISVPNSQLINSVVTNYHSVNTPTNLVIPIGVSYESDLEKVETVTANVAEKYARGAKPYIIFTQFSAYSIDLEVHIPLTEYFRYRRVRSEFMKELTTEFRKHKITIPFPITTVEMKKG